MCSLFATVWSEEELDLGFDQKLLSLTDTVRKEILTSK